MGSTLTLITERIDDLPLLVGHMERMGLAALLNRDFPTHGHWKGLSLGHVCVGWLSHILAEADYRMKGVERWAGQRTETFASLFAQPVRGLDFSDDRLAALLEVFSDDERWGGFEAALNGTLLRVYDLTAPCVRLDATSASGYFSVSEDGIFQFGHSKDHRPDLPQVKVMLSALDPMGLPLAAEPLAGNRADDPLYRPAIASLRQGLGGQQGLLYVGDAKMASLDTRAFVVAGRDYYLCPLPKTQMPEERLAAYLDPLWREEVTAQPIWRTDAQGQAERIAEGFERTETVVAFREGMPLVWQERHLIIRSVGQARAATEALDQRLERALAALSALNERKQGKKRPTDWAQAHERVEAIIERFGVKGLIEVDYAQRLRSRSVCRDRPEAEHLVGEDVSIDASIKGGRAGGRTAPTRLAGLRHEPGAGSASA